MISYNEIATNKDKNFLMQCKSTLGVRKFKELVPAARLAFELAYNNEPSDIKRENVAKRAANLIYTHAVKALQCQ